MASNYRTILRVLPIIGILFILVGYVYVIYKIKDANVELSLLAERKQALRDSINVLENTLVGFHNIIQQSNDSNLIDKAKLVDVTSKQEAGRVNDTALVNSRNDYALATQWEEKGFDYLFNKDVDHAIEAFSEAENAYKSFHQVYEIKNYLTSNRQSLLSKESNVWPNACHDIATKYRWKMPETARRKLLHQQ